MLHTYVRAFLGRYTYVIWGPIWKLALAPNKDLGWGMRTRRCRPQQICYLCTFTNTNTNTTTNTNNIHNYKYKYKYNHKSLHIYTKTNSHWNPVYQDLAAIRTVLWASWQRSSGLAHHSHLPWNFVVPNFRSGNFVVPSRLIWSLCAFSSPLNTFEEP